ncbi:MAG: 4-amino-4-deoxy-L-arabinose transferase, partial [Spirosoma sp.]|nr:4-amino-4-deoxy-L-arabinose transferase [Spirosoma sp.]
MLKANLLFFTQKGQLLVISVFWAILAIAINPYGEFPYSDDWAYALSVKSLVETQTFFISGWTAVNLGIQIVWGALFCLPFGFSFTAIRISTLVAGLIGLLGTHQLIYNSTENKSLAFIGTLLMLVNPMYLGLSASFMTDVPFYALAVWSMSYMVIGLKHNAWRPMLIGLGFSILALLIRQLGIALFAGFGVAYIAYKGINLKSIGVAGITVIVGLGTQIVYQRWLSHVMPGMASYNGQASNFFHLSFYKLNLIRHFISHTFIALMYVGVFIFPYLLLLLTKNSLTNFPKKLGLYVLLTVIVLSIWYYFFDGINMPIWWNTLNAFGFGPMLLRDIYYRLYGLPFPEFVHLMMIGVTIGSLLGSIGILYYLIRIIQYLTRWSMDVSQRAVGILFFSVLVIYYLPMGVQGLFDRYLLLIPVLLVILIHLSLKDANEQKKQVPLRLPRFMSIGLLGIYFLYSVCAIHDFLAWNRVRWQALTNLMQQGMKP